eukprot:6750140-Prymnesium_polylepis.1
MADANCAVVSTQRHTLSTLASFLRWHLAGAGFDHVFLYFDSPAEDADAIALARDPQWEGRVTAFEATKEFRTREKYAKLPSWHEVAATVSSMVQARQRLNCEHCLQQCAAAGVRWLLHIDADELFMPSAGEDARAHFDRLDAEGCWQFTYRNVEAVPTSACGDDYFRDVSIFKQHEDQLPNSTAAHTALRFWLQRSHARLGQPVWFFFYSNGKSAVRVDAATRWQRLVCAGVHGWAWGDE